MAARCKDKYYFHLYKSSSFGHLPFRVGDAHVYLLDQPELLHCTARRLSVVNGLRAIFRNNFYCLRLSSNPLSSVPLEVVWPRVWKRPLFRQFTSASQVLSPPFARPNIEELHNNALQSIRCAVPSTCCPSFILDVDRSQALEVLRLQYSQETSIRPALITRSPIRIAKHRAADRILHGTATLRPLDRVDCPPYMLTELPSRRCEM